MRESIKNFTLVFAWPLILANTAVQQFYSYGRAVEPMADDPDKNFGKARPRRRRRATQDVDPGLRRVAEAIAVYRELYLDDKPHTPEELRIIRTPLGLEPR